MPHIYELSTELLSAVFMAVVDIDAISLADSLAFMTASKAGAEGILSLSHTSSRFRDQLLDTPQVWTVLPPLNIIPIPFLLVLLARSSGRTLSISFTESKALNASTWKIVIAIMPRIDRLCIEVEEGQFGNVTRSILTLSAPSLVHCLVTFHGSRNVCLNFDGSRYRKPFNGQAPRLQSLAFSGCYIPTRYCKFPRLSSLSLRHAGLAPIQQSSLSLNNGSLSNTHNRLLRRLVLWNCFATSQLERCRQIYQIELPVLEELVVGASALICDRLSRTLAFPDDCFCSVTVLLPLEITVRDAREAVAGVASFVHFGEQFEMARFILEESDAPSLHLQSSSRDLVATFDVSQRNASLNGGSHFLAQLITHLGSFTSPSITARDVFFFNMWDSIANIFGPHLGTVMTLDVVFSDDCIDTSLPLFLRPVFEAMTQTRTASFNPSPIYSNPLFSAVFMVTFPSLHSIVVYLDDEPNDCVQTGIHDIVESRLRCDWAVRDILFVLSPRLYDLHGFSSTQSLSLMIADSFSHLPGPIAISFV